MHIKQDGSCSLLAQEPNHTTLPTDKLEVCRRSCMLHNAATHEAPTYRLQGYVSHRSFKLTHGLNLCLATLHNPSVSEEAKEHAKEMRESRLSERVSELQADMLRF